MQLLGAERKAEVSTRVTAADSYNAQQEQDYTCII
jgi:hypothetical protein